MVFSLSQRNSIISWKHLPADEQLRVSRSILSLIFQTAGVQEGGGGLWIFRIREGKPYKKSKVKEFKKT